AGRLSARQICEPVTSSSVPFLGHVSETADADPHNVKASERNGPVVPARPIDDDLVHDDVETDMSRRCYSPLVSAEDPSANATDANARPFSRHLETNTVLFEWSAVGSCTLPLGRDLGQHIIDPDQQPTVTRGTLLGKR